MKNLINDFLDQTYSIDEIHNYLSDLLESEDLDVAVYGHDEVPEGHLVVGGYYDPDIDEIEVVIYYNPDDEEIEFNNQIFNDFTHQLQQTIEHEVIHRGQYLTRGHHRIVVGTGDKKRDYLYDPDEVDAFSNDIALDIRYNNGDLQTLTGSPVLTDYVNIFGIDHDIVKKIIRKAYKRMT